MVTHSGVNDLETFEFIQNIADHFRLLGVGQITSGDGVKAAAYGGHMIGKGCELLSHRLHNRIGKSGMGAEHCRGQNAAGNAHSREDGQGNGETALAHAGEILDGEYTHRLLTAFQIVLQQVAK